MPCDTRANQAEEEKERVSSVGCSPLEKRYELSLQAHHSSPISSVLVLPPISREFFE